jgi:hypothetical protein
MNKKHGLLFGFAVIAIAAIFTLTGCPTEADDDGGGGVPAEAVGDWKSRDYTLTLTTSSAKLVGTGADGTVHQFKEKLSDTAYDFGDDSNGKPCRIAIEDNKGTAVTGFGLDDGVWGLWTKQ